ncbi:Predicted dehydrogenase [Streptomyces sp. 1222.5]|uniref:Gfo/Idh/MocA family protein n=1 Tax=unclassified Streptomyces TaxID=2593676 RepID=UPI000897861D|nr:MULTISPECIES: Gfo/Idh/MocA family oxidoreductase [unclassified Streptomyces]PKW04960.1 putative dehydrogenase [Streptomyces sp. 5112.2]SEB52454.1 Predicted dehydrogenase [Streptomyces sp. 1222.5]
MIDTSTPWTSRPVEVGLVGAGPWARAMHARILAQGPETRLAAVWARRPEAAQQTAAPYGAQVAASFGELLDRCEAVAFAVPPAVQAELAPLAAQHGKALLLEKPLGPDLTAAQRVADAVFDAGVVSQLVLTKRYHPATQAFLDAARGRAITGARSCYLHGAFLGGDFATGWRLEHGALLDLGPHLLDLLDTAISPITGIRSTGDSRRWLELTVEHDNGAVSQASLSGSVAVPLPLTRVELFGPDMPLSYDTANIDHEDCWPVLRRTFATAVRTNQPPELDAARGLYLQRLIDQAGRHLARQ